MREHEVRTIQQRMEQYRKQMNAAQERIERATAAGIVGQDIGSIVHASTEYEVAKSKFEAVQEIVSYLRIDEHENYKK